MVFQEKNTDRSRLRKDENMSSVRSAVEESILGLKGLKG